MISALMMIFSAGALVQFFMSYCHSILATYAKVELSPRTCEVAGIDSERIPGSEFSRLLGLLRLARDPGDDRMELLTVRIYYSIVQIIGALASRITSGAKAWSEREGSRCAYFAAVSLDRRIAGLTN